MNSLTKLFVPSGVLYFSNLHPDFQKSVPQNEWLYYTQSVPELAILLYMAFMRGYMNGVKTSS